MKRFILSPFLIRLIIILTYLYPKTERRPDEFPIFRATCVPPKWRDKLQEQTPSVT